MVLTEFVQGRWEALSGSEARMIVLITHESPRRNKLQQFLMQRGYRVAVPNHREEVVPFVIEMKPQVIVLDLYVAEPSGIEVLRQLRSEGFKGRVVVLAGVSNSPLIPQAFQLGVDQVVGVCQATESDIACEQVDCAIRAALRQQISRRAQELWHERGKPHGKDHEIWLEAEQEVIRLP